VAKSLGAVTVSHRLPISTMILQEQDSAIKIVARGVDKEDKAAT
jgi:hypothetical protein